MRVPRHFNASRKKQFLQTLRSAVQVEKQIPVDVLKTKTRYEIRDSLTRKLPNVTENVVDTDYITIVVVGDFFPVIEVDGSNGEEIVMGFTDPYEVDTELELDLNLEITLRWDQDDNCWRVQ